MPLDPDALAVMPLVGMTTLDERLYLRQLAETQFTGQGAIIDLGSWLGSTTIALAQGLEQNTRPAARDAKVLAFDRFLWAAYMDPHVAQTELAGRYRPGDNFLDEFQRRVAPWRQRIEVCAGDLSAATWSGGPIELLVVDAMKSWELSSVIAKAFYPALVPGRSRLIHQDFAHFATPWIPLAMHRLQNCLQPVRHVANSGTVEFLCQATPTTDELRRAAERSAEESEIAAAFDFARRITDRSAWPHLDAAQALALAATGHHDRWPTALAQARREHPHRGELFDEVARQLAEQPSDGGVSPGVDRAWRVALEQSLPPLTQGQHYQLSWRMRAAAGRSVHLAITQGHEPWTLVGPYLPYRVGTTWQNLRIRFSPAHDEPDPVLQFRLGESTEAFELADATLAPLGRSKLTATPLLARDWRVALDGAGPAVAAGQPDGRSVRVEFRSASVAEQRGAARDLVRLEHNLAPLQSGQQYRLRFSARADRGREIDVAVAQAHPPWTELGLFARLRLWPVWQDFELPLVAIADEYDPQFVVHAAGSRAPFELTRVRLVRPAEEEALDLAGWNVAYADDFPAALYYTAGQSAGVHVAFPESLPPLEPPALDWKIQVQQQTPPLQAGDRCTVTLRAQADRSRWVSLVLLQSDAPYEPLGLTERVRLWPAWQELRFDFVVPVDDAAPQLTVRAGDCSIPLELADLRLAWRSTGQAERTALLTDPAQRQLWRAVSSATRLTSQPNGWRLEFPAG